MDPTSPIVADDGVVDHIVGGREIQAVIQLGIAPVIMNMGLDDLVKPLVGAVALPRIRQNALGPRAKKFNIDESNMVGIIGTTAATGDFDAGIFHMFGIEVQPIERDVTAATGREIDAIAITGQIDGDRFTGDGGDRHALTAGATRHVVKTVTTGISPGLEVEGIARP